MPQAKIGTMGRGGFHRRGQGNRPLQGNTSNVGKAGDGLQKD